MEKVWEMRLKVIEAQKGLSAERYRYTRCKDYLIEIDYWNDVRDITNVYYRGSLGDVA